MRILMLTESFPPCIGGVEKHVFHVSRELAARGQTVTVLTPRRATGGETPPLDETLHGVRVLRFPYEGRGRRRDVRVRRWLLSRLPLLAGCDAVHVHGQAPLLSWYLPCRVLLPWRPVFITFHGHAGVFPPGRRHLWERRAAARLTRANLCVGHYLEQWYGTRPGAVTYGGTVLPGRKPPRPAPGNRTVVFVGRLEPDTGVLAYIRALALLQGSTGQPWKLVLCGDGSLRDRVRSLAREKGLEATLEGAVPDPLPWMRRSRFVFASGYLALLEAAAFRRLALAVYENPLKRDYLEMAPAARERMVISGGAEALHQALLGILGDPSREAALVERAWRFASEQTWARVADAYLDLYRSHGLPQRERDGRGAG